MNTTRRHRATTLHSAWIKCCEQGLSITPGQFIVLCDILANPAPTSAFRRARRLRVSQPLVSGAQHILAEAGLVTLRRIPQPQGRIQDAVAATPTPEAYPIFGMRPPKTTATP